MLRQRPDDEPALLPERSADDSDAGWGEQPPADFDNESESDNESGSYVEDRPPHWQP